ncbi:xylose isomerase domain-containing protein [Halosimplex carlsbadense 2-9-1]|uniref:Xylose isomerase domain-containing protein n=1 Tax=Halosimplex carlsbadense 2-9-1 TaxID=797114 RepID=M0CEU5_9EURY|nr:sugar phosphate isomerase/epimerase [Halosimplex carlsbadense]ELZ21781.1 xylose isomerase domain-containing protein [Halosimplex carlsbadense 2-9-1]
MKIGCFAVVDPFETIDHQLDRVAEMGFEYADVTDNHPGGLLGREFGFAASVSLDDNPDDVKRLFEERGLSVTSVCAHANLLDPSAPGRYATEEVMKAIRLADGMGVDHVITTEGEPKTEWGEGLSRDEQALVVAEKLHEPVRLAESLDVELLIEPHGELTDPIEGMETVLDELGHPETVGVNLDTGNTWLGGADPVAFAERFHDRIRHVHWKDLPADWEARRGEEYGCGMSPIPLGDGVVDIEGVYRTLADSPHLEHATLEIAGEDNLVASREYLESLGAE